MIHNPGGFIRLEIQKGWKERRVWLCSCFPATLFFSTSGPNGPGVKARSCSSVQEHAHRGDFGSSPVLSTGEKMIGKTETPKTDNKLAIAMQCDKYQDRASEKGLLSPAGVSVREGFLQEATLRSDGQVEISQVEVKMGFTGSGN